MTKLTIEFDSPEAMELFMDWLSGRGEQEYWDYMYFRTDEEREHEVETFEYHDGGRIVASGR